MQHVPHSSCAAVASKSKQAKQSKVKNMTVVHVAASFVGVFLFYFFIAVVLLLGCCCSFGFFCTCSCLFVTCVCCILHYIISLRHIFACMHRFDLSFVFMLFFRTTFTLFGLSQQAFGKLFFVACGGDDLFFFL